MEFKYKGFEVSVLKEDFLFIWEAQNPKTGEYLADREGGELGDMKYARMKIKKWIDLYKKKDSSQLKYLSYN